MGIDVEVVVSIPHGVDFLCPNSLKVGREFSWAGGGDDEVASHVKEKGGKGGVFTTFCVFLEADVCGAGTILGSGELDAYAFVVLLVVCLLCGEELIKGFVRHLFEISSRGREGIGGGASCDTLVVCRGGKE